LKGRLVAKTDGGTVTARCLRQGYPLRRRGTLAVRGPATASAGTLIYPKLCHGNALVRSPLEALGRCQPWQAHEGRNEETLA